MKRQESDVIARWYTVTGGDGPACMELVMRKDGLYDVIRNGSNRVSTLDAEDAAMLWDRAAYRLETRPVPKFGSSERKL